MKQVKHIILIALLIISFQFKVHAQNDSIIKWDNNRHLTWDDYKDKPIKSTAVALTTSGLSFEYGYNSRDSILFITIESRFKKFESWVKPEGQTEKVLMHEQVHFNITELYARMLRKYFSEVTYATRMHFESILPRLYNDYVQKLNAEQNNYDSVTKHGIDETAQNKYEINIAKQIDDLSQFQQTTLTFKLIK